MTHATSADDRDAWVRARRTVARRHHPDLGGDLDTYLRELAAVDRLYGHQRRIGTATAVRSSDGKLVRLRRARARGARGTRRLVRALRGHLPRGVPGRRRYTSL